MKRSGCVWVLVVCSVLCYGAAGVRVRDSVRQSCTELIGECQTLVSQTCQQLVLGGGELNEETVLPCCDDLQGFVDCLDDGLEECIPPAFQPFIEEGLLICGVQQTEAPTDTPTASPTASGTPTETATPTETSTVMPTETPTETSTGMPTEAPTETSTGMPTEAPTETSTAMPTESPTETSTDMPTEAPTETSTSMPTEEPTETSTDMPTEAPTETSTGMPTEAPTDAPTGTPTETSTVAPTEAPTETATATASPTPSPTPTETPVCFPGDATVSMEDGSKKTMRFLEAGDRIMVAGGKFSDVFAFGHKDANAVAEFVRLETESGHAIELSGQHFILVKGELVAARKVHMGDELTVSGGAKSVVRSISIVSRPGVYSPHTLDGTIVVDDVEASSHTETVNPAVANLLLMIPKILYHLGFKEPLGSVLYQSTPLALHSLLRWTGISSA